MAKSDGPDWGYAYHILESCAEDGTLSDRQFSNFMQAMLVSETGWVIPTGSRYNVNYAIARRLFDNAIEHEKVWKRKFMVG